MKYSRYRALDGLDVLDSRGSAFAMDVHIHDEFVIACYLSGSKKYSSLGQTGLMSAGDVLSISPGIAHSAKSHSENGCHYIAIYPSIKQVAKAIDSDERDVEERFNGVASLSARSGGKQIGSDLNLSLEEDEASMEFALSVFLSNLAAEFCREDFCDKPVPNKIKAVWASIYEDPMQDADLGRLAASVSLSKEHLCRAFKAAYSISPLQLLRARRTVIAKDLIKEGMSLASAAVQSGFSDQSHMSRWFRRTYGVTPKSFVGHQ